MEKRKYVKPILSGEEFVPQNYCAACGENNVLYKFTCDAAGGNLYYFPNYNASGSAPTTGSEGTFLGWGYHPCTEYHEAASTSGFYWGYVDYDKDQKMDENEKVIVWRGPYNNNGHATTKLNIKEWETTKS